MNGGVKKTRDEIFFTEEFIILWSKGYNISGAKGDLKLVRLLYWQGQVSYFRSRQSSKYSVSGDLREIKKEI